METTKLLAGETNILSHGSTHRQDRDMGPPANERARQTTYTVKRLNFSNVILVTLCKGKWGNRPIFGVFGSRIQLQTCYGHGGWCI
jgi:hypothetical protein